MKYVGIVGHESAKFSAITEPIARRIIDDLVADADVVVSGGCHLGGIDIWAEEAAELAGKEKLIFAPKTRAWETGYRPRNILIAEASDIVHVIVVASYPEDYRSMRFDFCYHCNTKEHIKSGGCWTGKYAARLGRLAVWHVIP